MDNEETILEKLSAIEEALDGIKTQQAEIIEKLMNLNLETDGFTYEN